MIDIVRNAFERLLRLPELKGFENTDYDSLEAALVQHGIYDKKEILRFIYSYYCKPFISSAMAAPAGAAMVEIGSGVSPLKKFIPDLICTDLVASPWIDLTCSAYSLPFRDGSLDRIFLMFVCHHLGRITGFLDESYRCLKSGGEIVIIDPAVTWFSRFYYRYFHIDKMDLKAEEWGFEGQGRLSDSNIALPWMVFFRDREQFIRRYPGFEIRNVEYNTCLAFLLSGGMRIRQLLPTPVIKLLFILENAIIRRITNRIAVTMVFTVRKTGL